MSTDAELAGGPVDTVHQLRALVVDLHLIGAEFARVNGLHATDLRALICLLDAHRNSQVATPGWLKDQLHLNSASVTALVDRMERLGLMRRERDVQDRRRVLLHVTPDAMQLGRSFFGPVIESATARIEKYSAAQRRMIDVFLTDMRHAVDEVD